MFYNGLLIVLIAVNHLEPLKGQDLVVYINKYIFSHNISPVPSAYFSLLYASLVEDLFCSTSHMDEL